MGRKDGRMGGWVDGYGRAHRRARVQWTDKLSVSVSASLASLALASPGVSCDGTLG